MRIGVTSKSEIKLNAIKKAYTSLKLNPTIIGYSTNSKVGEQPVDEQTLIGAKNRIKDLLKKEKDFDYIISIENGIFKENKNWVDKAIIIIFDVKNNKKYIETSIPIIFPTKYIEKTKKIGFEKITVGEIMEKEGYIKNSKDPHIDLIGISREKILENTIINLIKRIK